MGGVQLVHPSPGVAANVGRIVPGAVVHDRPAQKLGARVMGVAIVVEEVRQRESSDGNGVARLRTLTRQLVLFVFKRLLLGAESKVMSEIQPGDVRLGGSLMPHGAVRRSRNSPGR